MNINKIFNLSKIPTYLLDKAYFDYEDNYNTFDVHYLAEDFIFEADDNNVILSSHDVVNDLLNNIQLSQFQIKTKSPNGVDYIEVSRLLDDYPDFICCRECLLIPDINKNVNIITDFLDGKGYCLVKKSVTFDNLKRKWFVMIFDPIRQESIKEQVLKYHDFAYHTSPINNADSIEANGIMAKQSNTPYKSLANSVFLYLGVPKNPKYVNMMRAKSRMIKQHDKSFNGDFIEYKISLDLIPNADFFIDVHGYDKDYIYTTSNIPPSAIIDMIEKSY